MKICQEGFYSIFNVYFGTGTKVPTFYVGLYTNATEPVIGASLTSLSELSGTGYVRKAIESWSVINEVKAWANGSTVTWSVGLSTWSNVNGYFLTNVLSGTSGSLLAVNQFESTKTLYNELFYVIINFTHAL